jgi:hypothetical protein
MDNLDHRLARVPADGVSLDGLENDVWARVHIRRAERFQNRLRMIAIAFALSVGVANGGMGASLVRPASSEMSVFNSASLSSLARLEVG